MFSRSRRPKRGNEPTPPDAGPGELRAHGAAKDVAGAALDSVAGILRSYGSQAFDTDELRASEVNERCEGWVRAVLIGDATGDGSERVVKALPRTTEARLNDVGVAFRDLRRRERSYVTTTVGSLRDVVMSFATTVHRVFRHDGGGDASLRPSLEALRTAAEGGDTRALRRQALATAQLVEAQLDARRERHEETVQQLGRELEEVREALAAASKEAQLDALTGLNNRRAFDAHVAMLADLGGWSEHPATLLLLDVDNFKAVNDTYGHPAGDAVLRSLADCLSKVALRRSDFVARYGGEEFAVVLADTGEKAAQRIVDRLLTAVRTLNVETERGTLQVTVSVGAAPLQGGEATAEWLQRADQALYASKCAGRDQAQWA